MYKLAVLAFKIRRSSSPEYLVSGISSLFLFVNLILVPVLLFATNLFHHPALLPLSIHHSVPIPLSFTPGLKPTSFTKPTPVVSPPRLPPRTFAWTVSFELRGF